VFIEHVHELGEAILTSVQPGDVVITMGAGSIGGVPGSLARMKDEK
jgi:UDP-N-acetylmuramate--alanine ligase